MESLDLHTLCVSIALINIAYATIFFMMYYGHREAVFLRHLGFSACLLAAVGLSYLFASQVNPFLFSVVTNASVSCAIILRYFAARDFNHREARLPYLWFLVAIIALLTLPIQAKGNLVDAYAFNTFLHAIYLFLTAYEYYRDSRDGLLSRLGLIVTYAVVAAAFFVRSMILILGNAQIGALGLPEDQHQILQFLVAMIACCLTSALALSAAFERTANVRRDESHKDALTGTLNRRGFENASKRRLDAFRTTTVGVITLDIDHFKTINDLHGHPAGDAALIETANSIRQTIPPDALFARIGGEEFAILLFDHSREDLLACAETIRRQVESRDYTAESTTFGITLSLGVFHYDGQTPDLWTLLAHADTALYQAKRQGRNQVVALWQSTGANTREDPLTDFPDHESRPARQA